MSERTKNSARNMTVAWMMQIFSICFSFVSRTVFIKLLPAEYLGLNSVFTNILSILSLSELGIGTAIIVSLYKPISEDDRLKIRQLMTFYASAYRVIGIFVIACGFILLPFIPQLCKTEIEISGLRLYFIVYVFQSASSYFFAYRRSLITAYQKEYICTLSTNISVTLTHLVQIIVLLLTKNYFIYLLVGILFNVLNNVFMYIVAEKKYPFIKHHMKDKLGKIEIKALFKDVKSIMVIKIGRVIVDSTDNLLISSYLGLFWNGLYSNYILLINSVNQFVNIIFSSMSASIGDFNASRSADETYKLFKIVRFMTYWVYGFCAICFATLFQPFITMWVGDAYLLDYVTVIVVIFNFYFAGFERLGSMFSSVARLFSETRIKTIATAGVNFVCSVILMRFLGLKGVFLGTVIGHLSAGIWVDAYFLYKRVFHKKLTKYFLSVISNTIVVVIIGLITYFVCSFITGFVLKTIVCVVVSNILFIAVYFRTDEFLNVKKHLLLLLRKK